MILQLLKVTNYNHKRKHFLLHPMTYITNTIIILKNNIKINYYVLLNKFVRTC